jgi:Mg2+ and Co2+ transporter CorA
MTSKTTIATNVAGLRPCTPEAHQRAGIDQDDLGQILDSLLALEDLLSSAVEVQPEHLASLLHIINNQFAQVMKGA